MKSNRFSSLTDKIKEVADKHAALTGKGFLPVR